MNPANIRPIGNSVLVELQENDTIVYKSLQLLIPEYIIGHQQIAFYCGKVVVVPKELDGSQFQWETDMELQKDDIVVFMYNAGAEIEALESYIRYDNKKYANINYQLIYLRIRGGVMQGVNGYVITESIEKKDKMVGGLLVPQHGNERHLSVVKAISTPNKAYRHFTDVDESTIRVDVGDVVLMDRWGNSSLEFFSRLFDKELYANQRKNIIGKLIDKDMPLTNKNFKLYGNRLLVKSVTEDTKTASGLFIPSSAVKKITVEVIQVGHQAPKGYEVGNKFLLMPNQLNDANSLDFEGEICYFIGISEYSILGMTE